MYLTNEKEKLVFHLLDVTRHVKRWRFHRGTLHKARSLSRQYISKVESLIIEIQRALQLALMPGIQIEARCVHPLSRSLFLPFTPLLIHLSSALFTSCTRITRTQPRSRWMITVEDASGFTLTCSCSGLLVNFLVLSHPLILPFLLHPLRYRPQPPFKHPNSMDRSYSIDNYQFLHLLRNYPVIYDASSRFFLIICSPYGCFCKFRLIQIELFLFFPAYCLFSFSRFFHCDVLWFCGIA